MTEEVTPQADAQGQPQGVQFALQRVYLKDLSFESPMGVEGFKKAWQPKIFGITGVEGPQLAQILNTMCPQILFPYAREAIDSCAVKGSFPALALPPINFDALFARAVQEAQQAQAEKEEGVTTN